MGAAVQQGRPPRFGDTDTARRADPGRSVETSARRRPCSPRQPKAFFTIPHFDGYAAVLIQLKAVTKRALRDAIVDGWLACAPEQLADAYVTRADRRP